VGGKTAHQHAHGLVEEGRGVSTAGNLIALIATDEEEEPTVTSPCWEPSMEGRCEDKGVLGGLLTKKRRRERDQREAREKKRKGSIPHSVRRRSNQSARFAAIQWVRRSGRC